MCLTKLCVSKLCVTERGGKVVCVCVTKLCVSKLCVKERGGGGGGAAGYRIKNKNPTQRCGEKVSIYLEGPALKE